MKQEPPNGRGARNKAKSDDGKHTEKTNKFLFRWRKAVASKRGPPSSTTRHVLLTLSLHMDSAGNSAFPSTRTLEEETGVSRKYVEIHLKKAMESAWIGVSIKGTSKGWKGRIYRATLPDEVE